MGRLGPRNGRYLDGGDFPGGPVFKISPSNAECAGSIPGGGAKITHACRQKKPKHKTETIMYQIQ